MNGGRTVNVSANPATGLARPVALDAVWNAGDADLAGRFHPLYRQALDRLPDGDQVFRGVPFSLGLRSNGRRWLLLDREVVIDLRGHGPASHLVIAHFADSWRDPQGARPPGTPVGWVMPQGEPLARYELVGTDGRTLAVEVRRRFEINDGIIGWGFLPFAAVGHRSDEVVDWRGPHPRQSPGRYAPAGHAGPLTTLPGAWGPAQTGVSDHVPTPDDDVTLWLHAIPLDARADLAELHLAPLGGLRPGTDVVVAAVTLFSGTASPLIAGPRRQVLVQGFGEGLPGVDLGIAIRSRPLGQPPAPLGPAGPAGPIGWGPTGSGDGHERAAADRRGNVLDLAVAPDALLRFGDWQLPADRLDERAVSPDGRITVRPLAPRETRVEVTVTDGPAGEATPARVRFVAADGRYLPPRGHRDEVNPGLFEDLGTDISLGGDTYAYVPGTFEIDLPPGAVEMEVVKGFDHRPVRTALVVGPETRRVAVSLERPIDLRPAGWMTADPHVHFLAPSTALLQAAAEDVAFVHLLATQWGDQFTSVNDLPWGSATDPGGRHAVIVGTENRSNMLGHLGLLGARRPVLDMASGGAPEGQIGGALSELLADWADRCHAEGGLVVASHFPLPFAEIATDIVTGRIDAVEMQCFAPGLDTPSILEWYRFLNCGYRLPVLGGTDKMSAEVPVGAVRTYARLDPDAPNSFESWASAVRAGRTFATSGPVIELIVDGHAPGDVISLPASGGHLEARVRARAAQPLISAVELVVNGRVVAVQESETPTDDLRLETAVDVSAGAWIAARSRSAHEIRSAFTTSMASHTSPVYVEVQDHPLFSPDDAGVILEVIDGTLGWVRDIAAIERAQDRRRMTDLIAASGKLLRERIQSASATSSREVR
jgi:hypothetical protein